MVSNHELFCRLVLLHCGNEDSSQGGLKALICFNLVAGDALLLPKSLEKMGCHAESHQKFSQNKIYTMKQQLMLLTRKWECNGRPGIPSEAPSSILIPIASRIMIEIQEQI